MVAILIDRPPILISLEFGMVRCSEVPIFLSDVHDVFHVSQLKKCLRVPTGATELEELDLQPDLSYPEHPIRILEEKERKTRNHSIKLLHLQYGCSIEL